MEIIDKLLKNDLRKMRFLVRYSGQYLSEQETNSDHVWEMISMALMLIPEMNKELPENEQLNIENIIYRIVVHDLDESLTSDIPRTFKYYSEKLTNAIKEAVDEIMKNKFDDKLYNDIKYAKDHSSREGLIVSILDTIQVSTKYTDEIINCGNHSVKNGYIQYNITALEKLKSEIDKVDNDLLYSLISDLLQKVINDMNNVLNKCLITII